MKTQRLTIVGRVQGVGFRYHFDRTARGHGVTGWVRNRRDGSVEAVVQGEPQAVDAVIAWARRGPPGAVVTQVEIHAAEGSYAAFEVRPSE